MPSSASRALCDQGIVGGVPGDARERPRHLLSESRAGACAHVSARTRDARCRGLNSAVFATNHIPRSELLNMLMSSSYRLGIALHRDMTVTCPLPTLDESHIVIDAVKGTATASLVFADKTEFPIHIGWQTLRSWAVTSKAHEVKAAILEHYADLAPLAMQARTTGETFLTLI